MTRNVTMTKFCREFKIVDGSHAHDGILTSNAAISLTLGKKWEHMEVYKKMPFVLLAGLL